MPREPEPDAFEQFVQKIAAVPKEAVEELDVRDRTIKVKRRRKVAPAKKKV